MAGKQPKTEHSADVMAFLGRIYSEKLRRHACRARTREEWLRWQAEARPALLDLLKMPRIACDCAGHKPGVELSDAVEDQGGYTRRRGVIETEPGVRIAFWMLHPKRTGPLPLAITPHGHENGDTYVGIWNDAHTRAQVEKEDQDVAVQAVKRGFLTIAPATRGINKNPASFKIADLEGRHRKDCHCHNWYAILAGRTLLGERVWDLMRLLDWALTRENVDASRVLMMGNSGGGMATLHAAACDPRITTAVPCGCYNGYVGADGGLRHCTCNVVPGMMEFGEYWDVAGLVAPRPMLTVNGSADPFHGVAEVEDATARLKSVYRAAGAPDNYEHQFGPGAHRFFAAVMWPWVDSVMRRD